MSALSHSCSTHSEEQPRRESGSTAKVVAKVVDMGRTRKFTFLYFGCQKWHGGTAGCKLSTSSRLAVSWDSAVLRIGSMPNRATLGANSFFSPFAVLGGDRARSIGRSLDGGGGESRARLPKRLRFFSPATGVVLHRHGLRRGVWCTDSVQVVLEFVCVGVFFFSRVYCYLPLQQHSSRPEC